MSCQQTFYNLLNFPYDILHTTINDYVAFTSVNIDYSETCNDGLKNQDETGKDCGGVCRPCVGKHIHLISWNFLIIFIFVMRLIGFQTVFNS